MQPKKKIKETKLSENETHVANKRSVGLTRRLMI